MPLSRSAYPSTPLLKAKEKVDVSCVHVQYIHSLRGSTEVCFCVDWKCRKLCCGCSLDVVWSVVQSGCGVWGRSGSVVEV